jgi:nitroreductase
VESIYIPGMEVAMVSRRTVIAGGAGAAALAAGLGYRIWDRGVFAGPGGPAYAPWGEWRGHALDGIKRPLYAAILAANPHDTQPWLFEIGDETITVYADRARNLGAFDPFRREMQLGLGAAIENLTHAAKVYGYTAFVRPVAGRLTLTPPDEPVAVAHISMDPAAAERDLLFEAIPDRHTHRGVYLEKPVEERDLHLLAGSADSEDVRVAFVTDAKARNEMGALIVAATERIISDPEMSAASARWIRSGRRDVLAHRDGITIDAAGLSPTTTMFGKLMPDMSAATQDQYWLGNTKDTQIHAPVLGAILVKDRLDRAGAIVAGRAWQRLHLTATRLGLVCQPLNQPVECVDRNAQLGRADTYRKTLMGLTRSGDFEATFTFRLGHAEKPAPLSPRRPLEEVLKRSGYA